MLKVSTIASSVQNNVKVLPETAERFFPETSSYLPKAERMDESLLKFAKSFDMSPQRSENAMKATGTSNSVGEIINYFG